MHGWTDADIIGASKVVKVQPRVNEELPGTNGRAVTWAYPQPPMSSWKPQTDCQKVSLSNCSQPVGVWRKYQESTCFRTHFLGLKWCHKQSYSFRQSPNWVTADRAQYVWSSSSLITIVVMNLFWGVVIRGTGVENGTNRNVDPTFLFDFKVHSVDLSYTV